MCFDLIQNQRFKSTRISRQRPTVDVLVTAAQLTGIFIFHVASSCPYSLVLCKHTIAAWWILLSPYKSFYCCLWSWIRTDNSALVLDEFESATTKDEGVLAGVLMPMRERILAIHARSESPRQHPTMYLLFACFSHITEDIICIHVLLYIPIIRVCIS